MELFDKEEVNNCYKEVFDSAALLSVHLNNHALLSHTNNLLKCLGFISYLFLLLQVQKLFRIIFVHIFL